jgi:SPP1 family predicted phage head-tail adaptor
MIIPQITGNFDQKCTFQSATNGTANSDGETSLIWADTYVNVQFEEMLHSGGEKYESDQQVWSRSKRIKIRRLDRTITAQMRFVLDGVNYYVTNVERFLKNRLYIIVTGEAKDND